MTRPLSMIAMLTAAVILSMNDATTAAAAPGAPLVADPFAYCASLGTIDTPLGGASPVPGALAPLLRTTLGLSAQAPLASQSYFWRCMDGAVYVCATGANLRCDVKADVAERNPGADNYCRENPKATIVPAYATGHNTIYEWNCSAGNAVPLKRTIKLDRRGYRADIWYRVSRR